MMLVIILSKRLIIHDHPILRDQDLATRISFRVQTILHNRLYYIQPHRIQANFFRLMEA